ncbi:collagen-like protein [Enterococcus plantarum]|uniref:Collagen-like protein n=1 Tax=Enterococcus plantarum TaxID=1077675 RepID=A0A2W3ZQ14_9ENTE|nr:collagen-like protein [Enterococcus plantarum]MBO0467681.1 collagen-like protein [Enterococcus plantarum]PZL70963.1 collagen-like protein [Enterococcus plantarum]
MTDIVELKSDGFVVYPKTHVSAIEGMTTIKGEKGDTGPQGIPGLQGPAGINATTTADATQTVKGLMSAADKKKLDTLPTITFSKVGAV